MTLSITPTKLSDYLNCPYKFKLRHLEKNGGISSSAAFSFGTSVHKALQELHSREGKKGSLSGEMAIPAPEKLLTSVWQRNAYESDEQERAYFLKGCQALTTYCKGIGKDRTETLGTEVYMSFMIDSKGLKIRLGCKADRLALDENGHLEIIDYKTNRSGGVPTPEYLQRHLPTFIYYVLTRLTYPQYPDIKITFLNVMSMSKVSIEYEKDLIDENKRALWDCLKTIATGTYAPSTSEACAWCEYQDGCPAIGRIVDFEMV